MTFSNAASKIGNMWAAEAQAQQQSRAVRLQPMYVIVGDGHIFGFGLTPKKAMERFLDGLWYDGPPLDTRPLFPGPLPTASSFRSQGYAFCRLPNQPQGRCSVSKGHAAEDYSS